MRNNEIRKRIQGRMFSQFVRHTRSYLPNKPGLLVIECKSTGRMVVFSTADLANRAQKVMDYVSQNPFYKETGVVDHTRLLFWFSIAQLSECLPSQAKRLINGLGQRLYVRGSEASVPGWRGYKILHRPSGLYFLVKRDGVFDFSAWYRKLAYNIRHDADGAERLSVVALTSHSGTNGVRKEDFVVYPMFAGVDSEKDAQVLLRNETSLLGTDKLLTKGLVSEDKWALYQRLNPIHYSKRMAS